MEWALSTGCDTPPALFTAQQIALSPQGSEPKGHASLWRGFATGLGRQLTALPMKSILRLSLLSGIISYLVYRLSSIGWGEIWAALPTSPLFYTLSFGFVLAPVVAEIFAFQTITKRNALRHKRVFLRKHVLNKAVMNFSGDAYFVQNLSKTEGIGLRRAAIILKDMTIIRAFVANAWIVLLVLAALALGKFDVLQSIATISPALAIIVSLFCLSVIGCGLFLFRKFTQLEIKTAAKVAAIYTARSCVIVAILLAQWSLAIPGMSLANWFVFLIVFYIAKKSPVSGELVFASVIVSLPGLGGDTAAVAAMLIAIAAVAQIFYFAGFLASIETSRMRAFAGRQAVAA